MPGRAWKNGDATPASPSKLAEMRNKEQHCLAGDAMYFMHFIGVSEKEKTKRITFIKALDKAEDFYRWAGLSKSEVGLRQIRVMEEMSNMESARTQYRLANNQLDDASGLDD